MRRSWMECALQILAHASPFASVPGAVQEKVGKYGLGLLSPWVPQQYVLTHPVRRAHVL